MKSKLLLGVVISLIFGCSNSKKEQRIQTAESARNERAVPKPGSKNSSAYLTQENLENYVQQAAVIEKPNALNTPFDELEFNKVIIYDYVGSGEPHNSIINEDNKFVPVVMKQQSLNREEVRELITLLTSNSTYGSGTSACFEPHMGIVFYNNNSAVNKIDICMSCNYLISDIEIPATSFHKLTSGNETFPANGFSEKGKKSIEEFCRKFDFRYGRY